MRRPVGTALAATTGAILFCLAVQQERSQQKWLSAFVGVRGPASVTTPPLSLLDGVHAQARAGPRVLGNRASTGTYGRAAWALAALCAVAAARGAVSRVACRSFGKRNSWGQKKKFFPPNKWDQYKMHNMGYRIKGAPGFPGSPHYWTEPIRWCQRFRRRIHIRRKLEGTCARPRLAIFRSLNHTHVNVVDDTIGLGEILVCATTKQKPILEEIRKTQEAEEGQERTWTIDAAEVLGREVAKKCLEKNITMVVFDRGGFPYKGRVKALAEAARSGGLQF